MNIKIIEFKNLYEYTGSSGQAHFGFLILLDSELKPENRRKIIHHEKQHLVQQKQFLIFGFYIIYVIDYLIQYIKFRDSQKAYKNIYFEKKVVDI